jgi:plasmid stabilization system protein ParE
VTITYTADARADIEEIGAYIAEDNPARARTFVQELRAFLEQIPDNPRRYRLRDEWGGSFRAAHFGSYLAIFEETEEGVAILRIANGSRNIADLLEGSSF